MFWLAWVAYLLGVFQGGFILGTAMNWYAAFPKISEKGLAAAVILVLGLFTNIIFCITTWVRGTHVTATSWKVLVAGSLAVNVIVLIFFPVFAQNAGYWFWLIAFALMTWALLALPAREPVDPDGVLSILWVWIGCTLFWLTVMVIGYYRPGIKTMFVDDALRPAPLTSYVTDSAHLLQPGGQEQLKTMLKQFEEETSDQIAVAVYPRCPSKSIDDFTIRTAEASGFGHRGVDNGAVLFVFLAERTARIEVGYGLEGALPDARAYQILAAQAPRFSRGEYQDAIAATLSAMCQAVKEEYHSAENRSDFLHYVAHLYPQLKVAVIKCARNLWPLMRDSPLQARLGLSFFGGLLGLGVWDGMVNGARIVWDAGLGVSNLIRRRRFRSGMKPFTLGSIGDTVKLAVILAVIAGGYVMVAGQGSFGGGGAMIRWLASSVAH